MTIWLLALILIASLAALGYRQGAIRVGFSFFGILVGALLAAPVGRLVGKVLGPLGVKDPMLAWVLGPLIVFVLISIAFKAAAAAVHHKVDVHYRYHAGDLRLALFERLNQRLGICLGVLNGAAYLILLVFVLSVPSYVAFQVASGEKDPKLMRLVNRMGQDLHSTGFIKVARAIDNVPQLYYDMADFLTLIYFNPLSQARLSRYPAFLGIAELPEFQELANDKEFVQSWASREPAMVMWDHPRIQVFRNNPDLLRLIWNTVSPDLADVKAYLASGKTKYDEEAILGRWNFDVNASMNAFRRAKPNMPPTEILKWKRWMAASFEKTRMVARIDNQVFLRGLPQLRLPAAGATPSGPQDFQGRWKSLDGGKYLLTLSNVDVPATIEGGRLSMKQDGMELVFARED